MITSCTSSAGTPDRLSASRIATPPSSGALSVESAPRNLPIGVRAAPTMTGVRDLSDIVALTGLFVDGISSTQFNASRKASEATTIQKRVTATDRGSRCVQEFRRV